LPFPATRNELLKGPLEGWVQLKDDAELMSTKFPVSEAVSTGRDRRQNRELQAMRLLNDPTVVWRLWGDRHEGNPTTLKRLKVLLVGPNC
jgi:hypothetical protein